MGAVLRASHPQLYRRYLEAAEEASGLAIQRASLEGPEELLTRTDVAQPALFALSSALTEAACELGLSATAVAGHSLGEYTAAVAAGALPFADGMRLVSLRGRAMAAAQTERPGAMAAIVGLDAAALDELCGTTVGVVAPANFNTPAQTVVSGEVAAVEQLMELAEQAGATRVVRLQVGAGFHSELMRSTQKRLADACATLPWADPGVPLASNASGRLVRTGGDVRQALVDQIVSPVRFVDCVRALAADGVTSFLELGPGRVLSGLVRQILGREADVAAADSAEKLHAFAESRARSA